ncbi:MAG: hypothetical protein ACOYM9_03420 [Bradymonadia bacterium]
MLAVPQFTLVSVGLSLGALLAGGDAAARETGIRFVGAAGEEPTVVESTWSAEAAAAFLAGAVEVDVAPLRGVQGEAAPFDGGVASPPSAIDAIARAEAEYLKAHLRGAEKALIQAVEALVPADGVVAGVAGTRALVLLAQVQFALGRPASAEKSVEHGLRHIPRFPDAAGAPPPEVAELVARLRPKLVAVLGGSLQVEGVPAGTEIYLAGVKLGVAPARFDGLPKRGFRVSLRVPGEAPVTSDVELREATVVTAPEGSEAVVRRFLEAVGRRDRAGVGTLGEALSRRHGAAQLCVVRVQDTLAVVARLDPFSNPPGVVSAVEAPVPIDDAGWRTLGRACAAPAEREVGRADAVLYGPTTAVEVEQDGVSWRQVLGWSLVGVGAAGLGVGGWYGVSALEAEDTYGNADTPDAARRARTDAQNAARTADVGFGVGGAMVLTGAVVLWLGQNP